MEEAKMSFKGYRDNVVMIGIDTIIMVLTGTVYQIAPRYQPRNWNAIVVKFIRAFREMEGVNECLGHYTIGGKYNEILAKIQDILFDIPEFLELNLTEREYEYGRKESGDGLGMRFVTGFEQTTPTTWYDDFIDLTAVMQNFARYLWIYIEHD